MTELQLLLIREKQQGGAKNYQRQLFSKYAICNQERGGWDMMPIAWNRLVLLPVPETDKQCHQRNIYISEIRIYLKPILKN